MDSLNKLAEYFEYKYRNLTSNQRVLPRFIIIGAQRAGTTSLFHYLSQHPQLIPSCVKEVHFFDGGNKGKVNTYEKGIDWYLTHFPRRSRMTEDQATFEASPFYLFHPLVSERIHKVLPHVKLIALLRNPVHRAISQYIREFRLGRETLPVYEAMVREEDRLKDIIAAGHFGDENFRTLSYKSRGLYLPQLERYYNRFPTKQILVLSSEEFYADPRKVLSQVYRFTEVDDTFQPADLKARNVQDYGQDIPREVIDYLTDYFLSPNKSLYSFLGRDFDW